MVAEAPVPRLPFQDRLVAVSEVVPAQVADQPPVKLCPAGSANARVQAVTGSPVLVSVMWAVKPPTPGDSVQGWAW